MPTGHAGSPPSPVKLALAFASIYFVWGSTFLAIRYAIEEIPPFLMAGTRFATAGAILYLWRRLVHGERPSWDQWPGALLVGALLFMGGNGSVVWSEQQVASGLTALLLATIPLWMVLLDALRHDGAPVTRRVIAGVALGLSGLAILVEPSKLLGGGRVAPVGAGVLVAGSLCWATGSLVSRRLRQPPSAPLSAGMQMMMGGVILLLAGAASGELVRLDPRGLTPRGFLSLSYLILFGSVVSFTAYTWLLTVTTPARVATYAYVNPIVAVLLGWILANEPLTPRTLLATVVIVTAVAMIISSRTQKGIRREV
ncbi:MAG TPA: EamA family transporter [Candidatus Polarisedimenticolia bacterium]